MIVADKIRLGFAMCGSFCTFKLVLEELERLAKDYDITPIMSQGAAFTDTRFGKARTSAAALPKSAAGSQSPPSRTRSQ